VIASIYPEAHVLDLSHAVPHYDIPTGSWMLRNAVTHLPVAVHVAVVDPGVGTARRGIGLACGRGDVLIGPDNGLLLGAAERLDGITLAVELAEPRFRHHPVSHTFHARDIFCPAAAHIARGTPLSEVGPQLAPGDLVLLSETPSVVREGALHTQVATINEFGSLMLSAPGAFLADLGHPAWVRVSVAGQVYPARVVRTFGEAERGERVLLIDSYGQLCLAINQGDLAVGLELERGARPSVIIVAAPSESALRGGEEAL
jgi:S-adenosylmethionine hydrolase